MKKFISEFRDFIAGGNMIELAVAFILGGAAAAVISAFTDNVMMQIVAAIVGKPNFDELAFGLGKADIRYGTVITALINLVLVGLVLFLVLKAYNRMRKQVQEESGPSEVDLLTEIRDALRSRT